MARSLWAQYKAEHLGLETIEHEWGFAAFCEAPDSLFIDEFYIVPEKRECGFGAQLLAEIAERARASGRYALTSTVNLGSRTAVLSLKAQLAVGFQPIRAQNDSILLKLNLEASHG